MNELFICVNCEQYCCRLFLNISSILIVFICLSRTSFLKNFDMLNYCLDLYDSLDGLKLDNIDKNK